MRASIRSRPWAGLDVGSYSVKLLARLGNVANSRFWIGEAPIVNPDPEQPVSADTLARTIADCMSQAGLSPRSFRGVSLGIAGSDVIVKQITLPLLDDSEVAPALRFEARKHLPFDPQSMIIDYQIIGRYAVERKLEILLAAVSQEHIEREMAPLRLLGIEPDVIEPAPLALANAIAQSSDGNPGAHVLLDIGHLASHVTLYQRGQPFFSRRLDFGGRNLTRAIAEGISVPFDEAEEWKLAGGSDEPGIRVDWDSRELQSVVECLRVELIEELRRSFAFYRTQGQLADELKLWISGGSARLPGLATRIGELLGITVLLFNPLESFTQAPRGGVVPLVAPQFTQAFGLALRSA